MIESMIETITLDTMIKVWEELAFLIGMLPRVKKSCSHKTLVDVLC